MLCALFLLSSPCRSSSSPPFIPAGLLRKTQGSNKSNTPKRDSLGGQAGERESGAPEASLFLAVFKLMKELPNYFASVDFHEKAPVISHNTLFISLA